MPRPLLYLIGTFGGTGFAPVAPATVASFAFALLWWLVWSRWGPVPLWLQGSLLLVVCAVGTPVAARLADRHGEDPSLVVIDEVAGMQVTFLGLHAGPLGWLAGFCWFRLFDIWKPLGLRRLERLRGGVGIMADDLGAGVLACLATHATVWLVRYL